MSFILKISLDLYSLHEAWFKICACVCMYCSLLEISLFLLVSFGKKLNKFDYALLTLYFVETQYTLRRTKLPESSLMYVQPVSFPGRQHFFSFPEGAKENFQTI